MEVVKELRRIAVSGPVNQPVPSGIETSPARLAQSLQQSQASAYSANGYPQQQSAAYNSPAAASASSSNGTSSNNTSSQSVKSLPRTQMPVIPAIFPELEELSYVGLTCHMTAMLVCFTNEYLLRVGYVLQNTRLSQLEAIATDRHALKTFVKKMHSVQEFVKLREDVMTGNMRIAESTLSRETEMQELQSEVHALRSALRDAQESLAQKQARQSRVLAVRRACICITRCCHTRARTHCVLLILFVSCSAIGQTLCSTSSQRQRKISTRRRTTSRSSLRTASSTLRSSVRSTCRSARCITSARSSSTRSCSASESNSAHALRWRDALREK